MSQKFYFYIDESWDHSLQNINDDFPYFLLCGVLISKTENEKLNKKIIELKNKFFNTEKAILHSRDIRKCEKHFQVFFDLKIKELFYQELNAIISEIDFTIISNAVRKIDYIKQYGKSAINPYNISLSYMLERMVFCLNEKKWTSVEIFVEKRWGKEDQALLNHYNTVLDVWTSYVKPERFKSLIADFVFRKKLDNDIGIQIADLCAYPLISYVRDQDKNNPAYKIIEPKIYINPKTNKQSWLKIIP